MLDNYRRTEDFARSTTDRQILRHDTKVHEYLKIMESGESHPDAETLRQLQEGIIKKDDAKVKNYLIKRLNDIPSAM